MPTETLQRPTIIRPSYSRRNEASFLWTPNELHAEIIYKPAEGLQFAVKNGRPTYSRSIEGYEPVSWLEAYGRQKAVRFPSEIGSCPNTDSLATAMRRFIHRYFDCQPAFESVAVLYALHTWVYEKFQAVPYLRFLGLAGTGKTRATQTIGALCYHAMVIAGAATPAAMYRMIEVVGGTLLFDEADFSDSQIGADVAKVLNCGYQEGLPVIRMEQDDAGEYIPRMYSVFGPKIINGRRVFRDDATESRCLSYTPSPSGRRDIPTQLPQQFDVEAGEVQNQALAWRFGNLDCFQVQAVPLEGLGNRSEQILQPLLMVIEHMTDPELRERYRADLISFAQERERQAREDNTYTAEAKLLRAYVRLRSQQRPEPTCGEVAEVAKTFDGSEDPDLAWLTPRRTSSILRGMGFTTQHVNRGSVLRVELARLQTLKARYGMVTDPSPESSPQGDDGDRGVMVAA